MQTRIDSGRVYEYRKTVGLQASFGERGFDMPVDVAVGTDQNLYVLSRSNELHNYSRFTAVIMDDEILFATGKTGKGNGEFVWPTGIALDDEDNVYIYLMSGFTTLASSIKMANSLANGALRGLWTARFKALRGWPLMAKETFTSVTL